MKRVPMLVLLGGLLHGAGWVAWAESMHSTQALPTPFPEARYERMSAKSPFAVASATAGANAAPTPGYAAQLYVQGVSQIGKKNFVAIKSRDPDQQSGYFLEVGGTSADGLKVESVNWSDKMGKTTVDVSKAGEKRATLTFDEAQMAKNATAGPAMIPGQPGIRLPTLPGQGGRLVFHFQTAHSSRTDPSSGRGFFPSRGHNLAVPAFSTASRCAGAYGRSRAASSGRKRHLRFPTQLPLSAKLFLRLVLSIPP